MSADPTQHEADSKEPHRHTRPVCRELTGLVQQITGYRENGRGLAADIEMATLVVPLVISFGTPFSIALARPPSHDDQWGSFAAGLFAGPVIIASAGGAECIQVNFTPAGAWRFFGLPMSELAARMASLDDLGDRILLALRQRLGEERDWGRRLDLAEAFVVDRLRRGPTGTPIVRAAYRSILEARGNLRIAALARTLDCSRKHLAERFQVELGLPPKAIARMVRFQNALSLAKAGPREAAGWAGIAAECGYADQAHLTREFGELGGMTPATWLARAA